MELYEVYAELVTVVKAGEPLAAAEASQLLRQRYAHPIASPGALLASDILATFEKFPEPDRHSASVLFRHDPRAPEGWIKRLDYLGVSKNHGAAKEYALRLVAYVAHELIVTWQIDAVRSVTDPLERISYEQRLEIDDNDHRLNTLHRTILARVSASAQRFAMLPYYYGVGPIKPTKVVSLIKGQQYVGSVPTPLGEDSRWWTHVIHLGRPYTAGEPVKIALAETYFDEERQLHHASPDYGVHLLTNVISPAMEDIHLAIRLPHSLHSDARPEWRVAEPPLKIPYKRGRVSVKANGWAEKRFDDGLQSGHQYGLFFPGTELYA